LEITSDGAVVIVGVIDTALSIEVDVVVKSIFGVRVVSFCVEKWKWCDVRIQKNGAD